MRFGGFAQHRRQQRVAQVQIVFARLTHRAQDIAATVSLFADQRHILRQIGMIAQLVKSSGN